MTKRRSLLPTILFLFFSALVCLGIVLAGMFALYLPTWAAQTFGDPAPGLGLTQRIYLSARLMIQKNDLNQPKDPLGDQRPFQVELGEPAISVVRRLQEEGLIPNREAFRLYLQYTGLDTTLQAGEYSLSPAMTPIEIAHALQDATPTEVTFRILAGWRVEEIAAALPTSGLEITPQELQEAALARPQGYSFSQDLPEQATMEGFLFPDTYRLARQSSPQDFLKTVLDNFEAQLSPALLGGFESQGLSLYEAVTLASIVEREAVTDGEMPLIASVFLNRLAAGIKLDTDPTVQYALGYNPTQQTWWTNPLSLEDLQVNSPYNTYLYPGLPPGPIANPGLPALRAVAFPAQTPYYYFRSDCDGSGRHVFAETFEEHLDNSCP